MPVTGATFLVGAAAISGLPPLNGFVSEFLIYLGAMAGLAGPSRIAPAWPLMSVLVVGGLALIGGLAAACFAKALGIVFLGKARGSETAQAHEGGAAMRWPMIHLTIDDLSAHAHSLDPRWLKAAFLFFLVGYGTKMGLAPLHTWLPDAHSEAPSVVSALLSGTLLNCAFLTILRTHALLSAANLAGFSSDLLVLFGLISMIVAAVFILGQADFKRMLAYSSVEHMGVLSLGIGIGGVATFGAMLHTVNHSLTKAMLFLAAGNILAFYRTKSTSRVRGVLRTLPVTGVLWLAGFLAIVGSPPFGPFLSELTILKGVLDAAHPVVAAIYLSALAIVFIGMATIFLRMAYGPAPASLTASRVGQAERSPTTIGAASAARHEPLWSIAPLMALGLAVLVLGVYVPPPFTDLLHQAIAALGVH
jgi:hydrogenase-4 component F